MPEKFEIFMKNQLERLKLFFSKINVNQKKIIFGVFFVLVFSYLFFHAPPEDFPVGSVFTVSSGQSLQNITNNLYDSHIIRSKLVFSTTVILLGGEKKVIAGDYLMYKKEGPADIAYRLTNGKFHLEIAKITILEGWNIFEISNFLDKSLLNFNKEKFINLAKQNEGYLFPDTYFLSPTVKPEAIIEMMNKNFNNKILDIPGISTTTYKFKDVITMASILEREARTMESRQIIAGILWKRISLGMPLQVDSAFDYVNGKNTFNLSLDDLKIDSPYNTYKNKGLPAGPIGNPGVDAIWAAMNPIQTKYLYFLTGKDGKMYYATTFEQHVRNKQKYLY